MGDPIAVAAPAMEAVGAEPVSGADRTYEQITDQLKADHAEPPDVGGEEAPQDTPATTQPTPQVESPDEFRTMTDEEIAALPSDLQREAKALRKRFQAAYTKKTQDLADLRRKAEIVDRFDSDPEFQRQVIQQAMARQGQATQESQTTATPKDPPAAILKMVQEALPPEMQWMAPAQAQIAWQIVQGMNQHVVQPLQQNLSAIQRSNQEREYNAVLGEFAEANPGWEAQEDAMVEVLEFLKSPALTHPRFGRKHDLLYRLAQGPEKVEQKAVETVLERTNRAVKSRSITSTGANRGTVSNLADRIRDRQMSDDQAWDLIRQQGGR